jgi:hypothetical protein
VANTLNLYLNGAVGFIDWLDAIMEWTPHVEVASEQRIQQRHRLRPNLSWRCLDDANASKIDSPA